MANKHLPHDLKQMQSLPLEAKIIMSQERIRQWYDHWEGMVYVSFSGGKDSTVLKHLVETTPGVYDVPSVFVNTGLEFPELQKFAMSQPNVITVRPDMRFDEVIKHYGYPVIGKKQARYIRDLQNASDKNKKTTNLRITGFNSKGVYCPTQKLATKWLYLKDAPFKIGEQCCDVMKKKPFAKYGRETGRIPFVGSMACESELREKEWIKNGCNAFTTNKPQSKPMSFWTEQDVLEYLVTFNIPYAPVYGEIKQADDGKYYTTMEQRTGCVYCMFGCHLEGEPNRFQRLQKTHPRQYNYCINGGEMVDGKWQPNREGLGLGYVLDYIGVRYE